MKKRQNKERKFSPRLFSSYMVGLYLGVNAVRDFYLLIDGPDCSYMKTQYIRLNHDFYSTLTNLSGFHRIGNTALHPIMMAGSREEKLLFYLKKIAGESFVKALGISPMPMAAVTAVDYKRLLREVSDGYKKPALEFPNKSLSGDWMDGYSEFVKVIARDIKLPSLKKEKRSVAVVGYLFDRNEYDNMANIQELKRIFNGIGVKLVSVWLNGGDYSSLGSIASADLILSLGYARDAALILSDRLNVPVIEVDYPIGFEATGKMLRMVADFFGIKGAIDFIDGETKSIVRRLEPLIEQYLLGINVVYCGDPIVFNSLSPQLELLGMKNKYAIISNTLDKKRFLHSEMGEVLFEPSISDVYEYGFDLIKKKKVDLYIGNSEMSSYFIGSGIAAIEIGFPSYFSHTIFEEPFVGFNGFLALINRIVRELRYAEIRNVFNYKL